MFFARDVGSANCLIPVYRALRKMRKYNIDLVGKDFACEVYEEEGVQYVSIEKGSYDVIVTGASGDDFTERNLWQAAKKANTKTIAILDHWINYRMRFDMAGKLVIPDRICVMDAYAKKEMVGEGFPARAITITGQPYFETVLRNQRLIRGKKNETLLPGFKIEKGSHVVCFASQPILEIYGPVSKLGYTQFSVLEEVINGFRIIADRNQTKKWVLVIKTHPRDSEKLFGRFVGAVGERRNLRVMIAPKTAPQTLIFASELVIGMSSMFLLEAAIAKRQFLSVQIGLKGEDPFVLSRMRVSKTILSRGEIIKTLQRFADGEKVIHKNFIFKKGATGNIINIINKLTD